MTVIQFLADWLMFPLGLAAIVALWFGVKPGDRFKTYTYILMAGLTGLFVARLMGLLPIHESTRPFMELGITAGASYMDNPGFPSDHTLFAFTLAFAVIFMTKWRTFGYILLLFAMAIGVGRVLALVHTPLDVVGGVFAAAVGALWYFKFYHYDTRAEHQKLPRRTKSGKISP